MSDSLSVPQPGSNLALEAAFQRTYEAIRRAKQSAEKKRSGSDVLRQLSEIEAHLNEAYAEAVMTQWAFEGMTEIAEQLNQDYETLRRESETAYQQGWKDGQEQLLDNVPGDGGAIVYWLIKTLQSGKGWGTPEWDEVLRMLRDTRRYLADHSSD